MELKSWDKNKGKLGRPVWVDRYLLHEFLWNNRDSGGYVPFKLTELAPMLRISYRQMIRIMQELTGAGCLLEVSKGKYWVVDPTKVIWGSNPD